ncbi:MAG: DNA cytosine methyltransferase [Burkholderiales bacterium]|nr:DNA cytosine methyltransferase [Burkholderiales bacterium]
MAKVKAPVVMDFFAGCGGLSLGLELAGFKPVFVNELNADAMKTYLRNRREHPALESKFNASDIKSLVAKKGALLADLLDGIRQEYGIDARKKEVDLVVGGPPCQGFSGIGHRRSYSVDKEQLPSNLLYQDYAYVISRIRPRIFLFENVRGLLSARWTPSGEKGEIWSDVRETLRGIKGYYTDWAEVRAKDYGVPQNRPRVLFVGIRDDIGWSPVRDAMKEGEAIVRGFLPSPHGNPPDLIDLLGDLIDPKYKNGGVTEKYPKEANGDIQERLRTSKYDKRIFAKGDPLTEQEYSMHAERVIAKFDYMREHGHIPPYFATKKFAQRVLPPRWTIGEGPTITATSLPDDYVHWGQSRTLTVREWARLQCFPDWYEFSGKRTTGGIRRAGNPREGIHEREVPKYTQIGNAVPVYMAEAVGKHFKKILGR